MAKTKVLIVEETPGDSRTSVDLLKRMGYSIAGTGIGAEEAFTLIESKHPHVILYFIEDVNQGIQFKADVGSRFQLRCLLVASKKNQPALKRSGLKEYIDYVGTPIEEGSLRASIEFAIYRELKQQWAVREEHEERIYAEVLTEAVLALTSHTSLNDILNELLVQAQRITPYKTANIMLLEGGTLRPMYWKGYEAYNADAYMANLKLHLKELPLNSEVIHHRKPTIINDTRTTPGWKVLDEAKWIRSCLLFPIVLQDQVLGQLAFDSETPNLFTDQDIERLKPLASAAASAIERAQLYESVEQELSERKWMDSALSASEARYHTLFETMPIGLYRTTVQGQFIDCNPAMAQLAGCETREELLQLNAIDLWVHPEERMDKIDNSAGMDVFNFEFEMRRVDGVIIWVHNVARIMRNPQGQILYLDGSLRDVTERKNAEKERDLLIERLQTIFNTMSEGVALNEIIYDENGEMVDYRILDVNPAFYKIADYRGVEVIGNTATKLYGMPAEYIKSFWKTHKEKNDVAHTEMKSPISETYFYVSTSPFKDNKFITSFFDITQLKEMESKLRLNQRAIESATEGIIIIDNTLSGNPIIFVNQAFTDITGYTFEEAIGRTCHFLQGKDTDPQVTAQIRNAIADKTNFEGDLLNYKKDGTPFWNHLRISPILDENGNCTHFVGLQIDVTEKKKKEDEHNLAELRYTRLFEHSMDAILLVDNNTHYVDVNPAACKLLGYSREELLALTIGDVTALEYLGNEMDFWHDFIAYGRQTGEYTLIHKDGTRIEVEYMAVANILPGLHLSVIHNITLRKQREKDLQRHAAYLSMLNSMTNSIFSTQDSETSIRIIAEGLAHIFHADGCYMTRWDDAQKLTIPLFSTFQIDPPYHEVTFLPNERTFTQTLMESSKVIVINQTNAGILPYSNRIANMLPGKSLIGIPLFFGRHKFGAAIVAFTSSHSFSELEIKEAKQAGDQISLALWNLQQEQELKKQLNELDTLSKILTTLSESERVGLQNVLQLIVDTARDLIPTVEQAVIHLLDEEKQFLIPEALTGFASSEERRRKMQFGEGIAGQAVSTGQLMNIPDVRFDSRFLTLNAQSKIRSLLVVPIVSSKGNLGTISVQSNTPNAFSEDHNKLLTKLGTQAAIAIENAHLIENTQQALKETSALYRVIQGVATAFNPENVMQDTVELLQKNFDYHYVQVFVADPDTGDFIMRAGSGPIGALLKEQGHYLISGEGIVGYTAETGAPFFTNDVDESVSYVRHPLLPDTKSELAMPVKIGDEMLGLIDIHQVPPKHLTQRDMQLVNAVADQLAIALQKATLYEELQISLEQEKAIRNQLVQNERLAVMGRLLASVSHELNNPLQAIQNALFLLKEEKGITQQGRDDLNIVLAESERMADMIDRLRTTYRPTQAHEFRPTQINNLVRDVHALIATHLRHNNVTFEFEPDPNLPIIPALSDQLRQVVLNLMMNAVEAMTDGGTLKVSTQYLDGAGEILLSVSDTGSGIHETIMPYIFDAFITNKERGTGLGLTITYDIVTKHRGRITAENNLDKGATFRIWLPLENREVI